MDIFSRFRTKKAFIPNVIKPAIVQVVGIDPIAWKDNLIRALERANSRVDEIEKEMTRVRTMHQAQIAELTDAHDTEISRLQSARDGTITIIAAARAALDALPSAPPPAPAPVTVATDQDQDEVADALESALNEVDQGRGTAFPTPPPSPAAVPLTLPTGRFVSGPELKRKVIRRT